MPFDIDAFLDAGALASIDGQTLIVGYGAYRWTASHEKTSFYFPDFFLEEKKPWLTFENTAKIPLEKLCRVIEDVPHGAASFRRTWQSPGKELFDEAIADLMHRFATGDLVKAVPYLCEQSLGALGRGELLRSLKHGVSYAKKCQVYLYGFWNRDKGMLGATPEVLFKQEMNQISTMACAGTRRRGSDEQLIASDQKELYEHGLVVDDIAAALSPYGTVDRGTMEVRPFNTLVHLVTPMHLTARDGVTFDQLVAAMHPTAALGAVPRKPGKEWLAAYDSRSLPRKRYGAPAAVMDEDKAICLVAIRNMQWDAEALRIFAGSGVVPTTNAEREWDEIQLKLKSIKEIFSL